MTALRIVLRDTQLRRTSRLAKRIDQTLAPAASSHQMPLRHPTEGSNHRPQSRFLLQILRARPLRLPLLGLQSRLFRKNKRRAVCWRSKCRHELQRHPERYFELRYAGQNASKTRPATPTPSATASTSPPFFDVNLPQKPEPSS